MRLENKVAFVTGAGRGKVIGDLEQSAEDDFDGPQC